MTSPAKETALKRSVKPVLALVFILALSGCVAGSAESAHAASGGLLQQLLLGIWHGLIAPVMLIVEVVKHFDPHLPWTVRMYEAKGTGAIYDVGFYLGLAGSPVALAGWSRRRR